MKKWVFFLIVMCLTPLARADQEPNVQADIWSLQQACDFEHTQLHPYSAQTLVRFLSEDMLNIAFLRGFSLPNSSYIETGYCIVREVGKPNHPYWEKHLRF